MHDEMKLFSILFLSIIAIVSCANSRGPKVTQKVRFCCLYLIFCHEMYFSARLMKNDVVNKEPFYCIKLQYKHATST